MTEDDLFPEVVVRVDKALTNPDHVFKRLVFNLDTGPEAGMHNIEILQLNVCLEGFIECQVVFGHEGVRAFQFVSVIALNGVPSTVKEE